MKKKLIILALSLSVLTTSFVGCNAEPEKNPWKALYATWYTKSLKAEYGNIYYAKARADFLKNIFKSLARIEIQLTIDINREKKKKEFNDCLSSSNGVEHCVNTILIDKEHLDKIKTQRKQDYKKLIKPLNNLFNPF